MPRGKTKLCEVQTEKGRVLIPYELHRRRGMRHLRVSVDESNQVTLKVPYRVSERTALEFLRNQGDWVVRMIGRQPRRHSIRQFLLEKGAVSALGNRVTVKLHLNGSTGPGLFDESARRLTLPLSGANDLELQLKEQLRHFSREVLPRRSEHFAERYGLALKRVTIRDQRTMWGSCTDRATLSLNWRLVLLPARLQDHIILHELAHLTYLDHSKAFWKLLEEYDPDSRRNDKEVTGLSPLIMRLGRF